MYIIRRQRTNMLKFKYIKSDIEGSICEIITVSALRHEVCT